MLVAVTSGKAAPGATTSTWAVALAWQSPLLVIDCDVAGGDMASGLVVGRVSGDHGLLSWVTATRRAPAIEAATMIGQHVVALPEASQVWLMPGLQNAGQAAAMTGGGWDRLALALERAPALIGRDVLVDTGRLGPLSCWPVLRSADQILLTVRPTVRSVRAAMQAAGALRDQLGDLQKVGALVVGAGPYSTKQVAGQLGLPDWGELPDDRAAAAVLSDGSQAGVRGLSQTRLLRAGTALASRLARLDMATRYAAGSPI
jgi:MinD-like ATPase involved in chromosome partitioning or flagellar assembly